MRAWEGYPAGNLDYFLGKRGQRKPIIDYLTKKHRDVYGSAWSYTPRQEYIIQNLDSSFALLDCIAGSGKTTILVSLALWMLRLKELGAGGCLHYVTETQEMVNEFLARVREVNRSAEGIAPIGYDREKYVDRLDEDLRDKLTKANIPVAATVSQLEKALDFLTEQAQTRSKMADADLDIVLEIFKSVLSVHHVTLHCSFYSAMRTHHSELLLGLTIVASTIATANRLNGGSSPWAKMFGKLGKAICVLDEMQAMGRAEIAGVCLIVYRSALSSVRILVSFFECKEK